MRVRLFGIREPELFAEPAELFQFVVLQSPERVRDRVNVIGEDVADQLPALIGKVNSDVPSIVRISVTLDEVAFDEVGNDGADVAFTLEQFLAQLTLVKWSQVVDGLQHAELAGGQIVGAEGLPDPTINGVECPSQADVRVQRALLFF